MNQPLSVVLLLTLRWCIVSMPLWIVFAIAARYAGATDREAWTMAVSHFRVGAACFWLFFPISCWEHSRDDTPHNPWPEGCNQSTGECPKETP